MTSKLTPVEGIENESIIAYLELKFQHILASQPSIHLLEVGCGDGALASVLQEKYKNKLVYKAIDPSKEAIEKAKARGVEGVEAISLEELSNSENAFDIVLFTKSFHHLASLSEGLMKIKKILKNGGLFIADEFAREAVDDNTAKFLYENMDSLEAAGKFTAPAKFSSPEDKKLSYHERWHSKFARGHSHGAHAGHSHAHTHGEHAHAQGEHSHAHGEHAHAHGTHEHDHGHEHAHTHGTHEHSHSHSHDHAAHGTHEHTLHGAHVHVSHGAHQFHPHMLPTSEKMINEIKTVFPNLEVTHCAFLYHFIAQRFEGSNLGEDIVKDFRNQEEDLIAKKQIVAIGLRFSCTN